MRFTLLLALIVAAGCKGHPPAGSVEKFALAFVDAARAGTPGAAWVDDDLVLRLRRVQRLQMAARGHAPSEVLAKVWNSDPDPTSLDEDRGAKQRERAAQVLRSRLHGDCQAERDPIGALSRRGVLTAPVENAEVAKDAIARLATDLHEAELVRVQCTQGAVGLLAVPNGHSWRVVDLFAVNENRAPIPLPAPTAK